ncbi:MAG: hypothetical protein ACKV2T_17915 [Kofleriaceae bacterium]
MTIARWLFASLCVVACSKTAAPPIAMKDGDAGLRELFVQARTACDAKDTVKGRAIVESLIPAAEPLRRALVDNAPMDFVEQVVSQMKEIPADDTKAACLLSPAGRTEILVHAATTEEIAARGTPIVTSEFPRGAQKLAPLLRPGVTFYEVETVEPGADRGTKFHMFYWDGERWRMLGPAWRYLAGTEQE